MQDLQVCMETYPCNVMIPKKLPQSDLRDKYFSQFSPKTTSLICMEARLGQVLVQCNGNVCPIAWTICWWALGHTSCSQFACFQACINYSWNLTVKSARMPKDYALWALGHKWCNLCSIVQQLLGWFVQFELCIKMQCNTSWFDLPDLQFALKTMCPTKYPKGPTLCLHRTPSSCFNVIG